MAATPPSSTVSYTGSPAVNILPNSAAQTYAHIHPTLLLAVYAFRFPAVVVDPTSTLLNDLPLYTALQIVYVVTCLPHAGSVHHHHSHEGEGDVGGIKANKAPYRKKHSAANKSDTLFQKLTVRFPSLFPPCIINQLTHEKIKAAFLSLTLTILLGTPTFALLLVLFGAPFTTHIAHTILCAAHMALLSVTPLVYVHGVDTNVWKEVWAFARPSDAVWGGALGACLGAWLGAIPIPLDWYVFTLFFPRAYLLNHRKGTVRGRHIRLLS
jgi:GPI ethanolamine phosphate transferase 2/3 subunit F